MWEERERNREFKRNEKNRKRVKCKSVIVIFFCEPDAFRVYKLCENFSVLFVTYEMCSRINYKLTTVIISGGMVHLTPCVIYQI